MTDDPKPRKKLQLGDASGRAVKFKITDVPPDIAIETMERLPEDDPVYSLIGQITANWAILDHILNQTIWKLADVPEKTGACITAQLSNHSQRIDSIIALARLREMSPNLIDEAKDLKRKLFDAADARNRAVHDPWIEITTWTSDGSADRTAQFRSMDKKKLKFGPDDVDTETLKQTLSRVNDRIKDCSKLHSKIWSALEALREKRKQPPPPIPES
jgi:hypothetical protein